MVFPHEKHETQEHGRSPGNGITPAALSAEPLATEGEATPGPDDYNPYEDETLDAPGDDTLEESPTRGRDDPFVFDDAETMVEEVSLPGLDPRGDGPRFDF